MNDELRLRLEEYVLSLAEKFRAGKRFNNVFGWTQEHGRLVVLVRFEGLYWTATFSGRSLQAPGTLIDAESRRRW